MKNRLAEADCRGTGRSTSSLTPLYVFILAAAVAGLLDACRSIAELSRSEWPAAIVFDGDSTPITVADSVSRSTPVSIAFHSFETNCTDTPPREDVHVSGDSVLIRSFVTTDRGCASDDVLFVVLHSVAIQLDQPGAVHIYVLGRNESGGVPGDAILTRTISVR